MQNVHLRGAFLCAREVSDYMIKAKSGSIINVCSQLGYIGRANYTAYSAAKGGLIAFTRALAKELAPYHVRVNGVCPGLVDTGFDYIEQPIIKITGGNGIGAVAEPKLLTIPHEVSFNTTGITSIIPDLAGIGTESSIGFTTYHKFRDGEKVVYNTFGRKALVGLNTGNAYFASILNSNDGDIKALFKVLKEFSND